MNARRELAPTLAESGDRSGSIQAYHQVVQLDPDDAAAHYSLGSQYLSAAEASGAAESNGSGAKPADVKRKKHAKAHGSRKGASGLDSALDQYALASKLDPGSTAYRSAYEALYEKVHHTPPPTTEVKPATLLNP